MLFENRILLFVIYIRLSQRTQLRIDNFVVVKKVLRKNGYIIVTLSSHFLFQLPINIWNGRYNHLWLAHFLSYNLCLVLQCFSFCFIIQFVLRYFLIVPFFVNLRRF
uniref:Uncharacterized protein n=1 Tax=Anopheles christyi TaxID=43041 RepID=A0A182KIR4_9DIPT